MTTFNAIDVETANSNRASICQIGIVQVSEGKIQREWSTLVDPEGPFEAMNISVHGIKQEDITDSPRLPEVYPTLHDLLQGSIVVSHTSFDRTAIKRSLERHGLDGLDLTWIDSARIARRTWPDRFDQRGYGLKSVANALGIPFQHHDALEDARTAALITLEACKASGRHIVEWVRDIDLRGPSTAGKSQRIEPQVGSDFVPSDLCNSSGKVFVVFTGSLFETRAEIERTASRAGCTVDRGVTKRTTALVVGMQASGQLKDHRKSSKQRKAEALNEEGQNIAILSEEDFWNLLERLDL